VPRGRDEGPTVAHIDKHLSPAGVRPTIRRSTSTAMRGGARLRRRQGSWPASTLTHMPIDVAP
jgi:hypothetical protein